MSPVWFITGASRGLGRALAVYALESGDNVVATARDKTALQDLENLYDSSRFIALALDVTDYAASTKTAEEAVQKFGRVDIVVNNAGYADTESVEDVSMESFRAQVETNFLGVVNVTKSFVPLLREQGSGHFFQVSSVGGRLGSPGLSAYQSSKWAVNGFSTVLATELAPLGIKVTVLEPGAIRTDWAGSSMKVPPASEPYKQTVGAFAEMRKNNLGSEMSLPEKFGPIIRTVFEASNPPVRLLVGPDAVQYGGKAGEDLAKSDEAWQQLSKSSI